MSKLRSPAAPRLAALVLLTVAGCDDGDTPPEYRLAADPMSVSMSVREQTVVGVRWVGAPLPNARVTWSAMPDSIVRLVASTGDAVTLEAQRAGAVIVTATATDGRQVVRYDVPVTVAPLACPLAGLVLSPPTVALAVGGRMQVTVSLVPPPPCGSPDGRVDFRIADPTVASVDSLGWITGMRIGVTTLQVSPHGNPGLTRATTVTVVGIGTVPPNVAVQPSVVDVADGDTVRLQYNVTLAPNGSAPRTARFASMDTVVATVDARGLVRGVTPGTTSIRVIADADTSFWVAVPVTVHEATPFLSVQPSPVTVARGAEQPLTLTIVRGPNRPATPGDYTFESRDPAIAAVSAAGVIRGMAEGTTSIVVRAAATRAAVRVVQVRVTGP